MLYAISGSQGTGKSTTLTALHEQHPEFNIIERKTSRSLLSDWGVSLDEINNDLELTIKFQEEISNRKWKDELHAIVSTDVWVTERTHMDLFTYALLAIGSNNAYSNWLNDYYYMCAGYSQIYKHVFFLTNGCFDIESDGIRGENKHYGDMVQNNMLSVTQAVLPGTHEVIGLCNVADRVDRITNVIQCL